MEMKNRIWVMAVGIAAMVMLSAAFAVPPKVEGLAAAGSAKSALRPAKRDLKDIDEIIIHCSATPEGKDFTAADIDRWHRAQGWCGIGYHFVIRLDGTIETGRRIDEVGAHCSGHNQNSIGVCYIGGISPSPTLPPQRGGVVNGDAGESGKPQNKAQAVSTSLAPSKTPPLGGGRVGPLDTRTPAQKEAMRLLVGVLRRMFPKATVHGHREFARKACPCFEVRELEVLSSSNSATSNSSPP